MRDIACDGEACACVGIDQVAPGVCKLRRLAARVPPADSARDGELP